ncbi:MAG: NAD(P)H-hydrate dehydratase [Oscillospiraceae bacterium]|jgi:NAD(P)H-hydrate epimerase|nr:NAD(P)H-hydrate dehydratase [Oscillospiraceae bacterium]
MKLVTTEQIREIDRRAIEDLGIPGVTLMSNAAEHIAKTAMEHVPPEGYTAVFCGTGNNGGDGIGAAAYLIEKGVTVRTFLIGDFEKLTDDAREMEKRLNSLGGSLERYSPSADLVDYVSGCTVVIDAIFGIGIVSDLYGDALSAVSVINSSNATVISADIPSGVHADTGRVLGDAVKADITLTFSLAKPGHFIEPGCIYCGRLKVCDIGIPRSLLSEVASHMYAALRGDILLPRRRRNTHKGDYGRALIIAGSVGYTGAPSLSARAATKTGAGLVFLGVPNSIYDIMAVKLEEEMPFPLPDDEKGQLIANAAGEILRRAKQSDVCLVGPGLGASESITELVQSLTRMSETPVVLDADGLNAIAGNVDILNQATCPLILTPHPGEFVRLGGKIKRDRLRASCDFASKHGCILVLKGHRTIIALPNGIAYVNTTGGPAMAKGGSGDVLAGMIAALIAQKLPIVHAVVAAVYIHGLSGDMCAEEFGEYSVTASDIIDMLPKAMKKIEKI